MMKINPSVVIRCNDLKPFKQTYVYDFIVHRGKRFF